MSNEQQPLSDAAHALHAKLLLRGCKIRRGPRGGQIKFPTPGDRMVDLTGEKGSAQAALFKELMAHLRQQPFDVMTSDPAALLRVFRKRPDGDDAEPRKD